MRIGCEHPHTKIMVWFLQRNVDAIGGRGKELREMMEIHRPTVVIINETKVM